MQCADCTIRQVAAERFNERAAEQGRELEPVPDVEKAATMLDGSALCAPCAAGRRLPAVMPPTGAELAEQAAREGAGQT